MSESVNILRIDSSARYEGSISRQLTDDIIAKLSDGKDAQIVIRDVSAGLPVVTQDWVGANFTPQDQRSPEQRDRLSQSDGLVAELDDADILVIGVPIYNFSVPAALKLWIDQVCRAGLTFKYGANGPEGLLNGKKAIIALASGGTQFESAIDFAGPYLRHVLGFIGVNDVTFITADQISQGAEAKLERANAQIQKLSA